MKENLEKKQEKEDRKKQISNGVKNTDHHKRKDSIKWRIGK